MKLIDKIDNWQIQRNQINITPDFFGMKEASNIIEFVTSDEFLGIKTIFPFQYKVLIEFFELVCPYCNQDIDNEDLDKLQSLVLFQFGRCPQCGKTKWQAYLDGKIKYYNELIGSAGTKAGKTTLVSVMIAPYILHKILFNPKIRERFNLLPWNKLLLAFISNSREQLKRSGWDYFISTLNNSRWFQEYFSHIRDFCKSNNKNPDDFFIQGALSLDFKFLNIEAVCLHSNAFSVAGGTFLFALIDEISRFEKGLSKRSADEIYRVVKNNLVPVREGFNNLLNSEEGLGFCNGDILDGILAVISAPISEDDKIMRLVQMNTTPRRFVFHRSSFEINPNLQRQRMQGDEEEDPELFIRDFDALPSSAGIEFISNPLVLNKNAILTERILDWSVEQKNIGLVGKSQNYRLCLKMNSVVDDRMSMYFIHADPGRVNDSFGIVIARLENDDKFFKIKIIEVIEIAIPKNRRGNILYEVDFQSINDFLIELFNHILIIKVSFDRWNSAFHIQSLREKGLQVEETSLRFEDYLAFRQDLYNERIELPLPEIENWEMQPLDRLPPRAKMLKELKMLRDFGRKVDHPPSGSSDLAVCAVGVHKLITKGLTSSVDSTGIKFDKQFHPRYNLMKGRVVKLHRFV